MYTFYSYYIVYQVYMFLYDVQCCFRTVLIYFFAEQYGRLQVHFL